ncbi:lysozyme inhibitor LprI family protein [Paraburkholderia acidisoli]|uniref:DUF1311 domain-containing protein n=1 Tax=Paraburkholderia acidisoli TaxID=2571748 RepID=A0A7Z2JIP0_9BURK|nr:lysozyme inhibitor LprI family protein [Paraburkholderia acidisoli]QGZ65931.1 DUF1311 domain-containing protein [Paraburkholderia acidisoli]
MRFPLVSAAALAFLSAPAWSAQSDCMTTATTQQAMNACAGQKLKASDQQLNTTYNALLAKTSKPGGEQLRKAQRAWVAWRDAQCQFDTLGTRQGSVNPMVYTLCVNDLTQQQTKHLAAQLHCEEGDLSCGGQ